MALELRNGIYYVRTMVDGKRVQQSTRTGDKVLAKKVHERILAELVLGKHDMVKAKVPTLREAYEAAIRTHYARTKSLPTVRINYGTLERIIGGNTRLDEVDDDTMQNVVATMIEEGAAAGTINRKLALLSKLLKLNETKLDRLPKVPLQKEYAGRVRILSESEETALIATLRAFSEKHGGDIKWMAFEAMVPFLIDSGLRLGEALALQWDHFDRLHLEVNVWESKGNLSRTVPLTDRASWALATMGPTLFGGKLTKDQAERMWAQVRDAMGLAKDEGFVLHCLRHTCCTRLIKAGINLHTVQKWMGHRDIKTTLRYSHLNTEDLHGCRDALQRPTSGLPKVGQESQASGGTNR